MKPISISERMMFNTVRLVASDGSSGTGYFYNFVIDNKIVPVIITNTPSFTAVEGLAGKDVKAGDEVISITK